MADWKAEYERKLRTPEQAMAMVKSGDRVAVPPGREPEGLAMALAARMPELEDVELIVSTPARDFGWFQPGAEKHIRVKASYLIPRGAAQQWQAMGKGDYLIPEPLGAASAELLGADVLLLEVSPPDEQGVCSLGSSVWDKHDHIRAAKFVVAEVNQKLIRPRGDTMVSISQIDCFVPHERKSGWGYRISDEISETTRAIGEHVATLTRDGDCLQFGGGSVVEMLPRLILENRVDLGIHSEMTARGMLTMVKAGHINGRRKNVNTGIVIATSVGGTREDLLFAHDNPAVQVRDVSYVSHPMNIAANDNMLSINQALSVDLTGQISAESLGPKMWSGPGGQPAFAIGTRYSRGGRFVTVIPATAGGGKISTIVPMFPQGTVVTVPRTLADYVVTEYGIVSLRGKSQRERAQALISIAHPEFRSELTKAAQQLF